MKFYDTETIFTFGKYEGETLSEVYAKDPQYIKFCKENIDEFYISPSVMKELKRTCTDDALLNIDMDKMTDDELDEFIGKMNKYNDVDPDKFEDEFEWDEKEEIFDEDEEDIFDKDAFYDEDFNEPYDDPLNDFDDSYSDRY